MGHFKTKVVCKIDYCNNPVHAGGYCSKHYAQMKREGKLIDNPPLCIVEGCSNFAYTYGYCPKHYQQLRMFGKILSQTIHSPNKFRFEGNDCYISLYDRKCKFRAETIIDKDDYELVKEYKWGLSGNGYVMSKKGRKSILLHRHLLLTSDEDCIKHIDHIDGDMLNNRRTNLRVATRAQNLANRGKQVNNTSGYKGVYFDKRRDKWYAKLEHKTRIFFLGYYDNKIDAAKAYDIKAIKLLGEFAHINFQQVLV